MIINFIGNFAKNLVGEVGDATHILRELRDLGHEMRRINQDEWKEFVLTGAKYPSIPRELKSDINIILKWHHFDSPIYIQKLRELSKSPVIYWCWDYMVDVYSGQSVDFHENLVEACDLYLGNDVRDKYYSQYSHAYYFPFDVADADLPRYKTANKDIDVAFFGSWISQGARQRYLRYINKKIPITIFSWNYKDVPVEFSDVRQAVYGKDFCEMVAKTKICLGFNVEPNTWGYWSNRTGKTLLAGGFLLQQYTPGMELFFRDGMEYFSTPDEAVEKIDHYLIADTERERVAKIGNMIGQDRFSSKARVKDLEILIERFLKGDSNYWRL